MAAKTLKPSIAISLLTVLLLQALPALSCGPFLDYAIFVNQIHPDVPLSRFVSGEIGLIQPTYARSYLFVAYRYLCGKPLNKDEQAGVLSLLDKRLSNSEGYQNLSPGAWLDARKAVPGIGQPPEVNLYRTVEGPDYYSSYLNCYPEALSNAASTLNERIKKFGLSSQAVKDWVAAQDLVFCHCAGPRYNWQEKKAETEPPFPQPAPSGADPLTRADRAYQIASAHFYAGQFDLAEREFTTIAADNDSPWKEIAPYLVARTLVRKGTLGKELDRSALVLAEKQLNGMLTSGSPTRFQPACRELLKLVRFWLYPDEMLNELSKALLGRQSADDLASSLYDYTLIWDRTVGDTRSAWPTGEQHKPGALSESARQSGDLTDWISTFQSSGDLAFKHAFARWESTHALPWLIAALTLSAPTDQLSGKLLEEARKVQPLSAGYLTVWYHASRLLSQSGKQDEARKKLDQILANKSMPMPPSARNALMAQRACLARNVNEFLQYSVRRPALITTDSDGNELPDNYDVATQSKAFPATKPGFDDRTTLIVNQKLPLSLLKQIATSNLLSGDLKRDVVQAVWVRAVLIGNDTVAGELTAALKGVAPPLVPFLNLYQKAESRADKLFAAVHMILANPGMRPFVSEGVGRHTVMSKIDDYQDNWWCAGALPGGPLAEDSRGQERKVDYPAFLSAQERTQAQDENKRLLAIGTAPNFLARQVVAWATEHRQDARVPEALSLAVKATRFGCSDSTTTQLSKQAFQLLHKNYPASPWAKRTKYWY